MRDLTDLTVCLSLAAPILQRWNSSFDCTASFQGHKGAVLSSVGSEDEVTGRAELYTTGDDGLLQVSTRAVMRRLEIGLM